MTPSCILAIFTLMKIPRNLLFRDAWRLLTKPLSSSRWWLKDKTEGTTALIVMTSPPVSNHFLYQMATKCPPTPCAQPYLEQHRALDDWTGELPCIELCVEYSSSRVKDALPPFEKCYRLSLMCVGVQYVCGVGLPPVPVFPDCPVF